MTSIERWVEAKGFPNYLVSNLGKVCHKRKTSPLTPFSNGHYLRVTLLDNGRHNVSVHRLVVLSFLDVELDDLEVNHIDGDTFNNCLWNLEPVTKTENVMHAFETGLQDKNVMFQPTRIRNADTGETFRSTSEAARSVNVTPQRIAYAVRTPNSKVKGYNFEMVE